MMIPKADLHRHERNTGFNEATCAHECLPIPKRRIRQVSKFVAQRSIAIERGGFFVREIKSAPSFAAGEHVQSLPGEAIKSVHLARGVDVAADRVELREKFLPRFK